MGEKVLAFAEEDRCKVAARGGKATAIVNDIGVLNGLCFGAAGGQSLRFFFLAFPPVEPRVSFACVHIGQLFHQLPGPVGFSSGQYRMQPFP